VNREDRIQACLRLLEDHRDPVPAHSAHRALGQGEEILSFEEDPPADDPAGGRWDEPQDRERRRPRPIVPPCRVPLPSLSASSPPPCRRAERSSHINSSRGRIVSATSTSILWRRDPGDPTIQAVPGVTGFPVAGGENRAYNTLRRSGM